MSKSRKSISKKKMKLARLKRHVRVTFFLVASTEEHLSALEEIRYYLYIQYRTPRGRKGVANNRLHSQLVSDILAISLGRNGLCRLLVAHIQRR